jgi:23S rRNA pseudouridine1911/1915/1917 synthase
LRQNDELEVDHSQLKAAPEEIYLPVIYEDEDVIVIDKPAGILTHSKGALNLEATVASFIKPKLTDNTLSTNRAGIVHRLDRPTSGVIITA